jgi:hypothetical protein
MSNLLFCDIFRQIIIPYKKISNCLQENSRNFAFGASTNNGRRAGIGTVKALSSVKGPKFGRC